MSTAAAQIPHVSDNDIAEAEAALDKIGSTQPGVLDGTVGGALDPLGEKSSDEDDDDDSEREESDDNQEDDEPKAKSVPLPDSAIMETIRNALSEIEELETARKEINAKISAIIENIESKGVNRHSFRYAKQVMAMDPKKREGLDLSYILVRQAGQLPVQTDWVSK